MTTSSNYMAVREVANAARAHGIKFLNQLYELLTEYGPIGEVWFAQ